MRVPIALAIVHEALPVVSLNSKYGSFGTGGFWCVRAECGVIGTTCPAMAIQEGRMQIRTAVAGDEERVVALMQELMEPPGRRPDDYSHERAVQGARHAIESADADILLAEDGAALIGLTTV